MSEMSQIKVKKPTFGHTRAGKAVHAKTGDHLRADTVYSRFNKKIALLITSKVGTMTCTWIFCLIALASLPAVLVAAGIIPLSVLPAKVLGSAGFILVISWLAQSFIQLVLLPAIMVGQNIQSEASDARAAKTFEDTETILDQMNLKTEGGLKELHDSLAAHIDEKVDALIASKSRSPRRSQKAHE